jgi:hypothetical protein
VRQVGAIDAYVAELGAALHGPRRAKADLLAEARDSLIDATEAYQRTGRERAAAERAAVRDFGELDEIVPGYQAELGLAQGRRTVLLVLGVFGAQPFAWGYAFRWVTNTTIDEPRTGFAVADHLVENLGGITILVAMLAVLAYRVGMRFPNVRTRLTRATGVFALTVSATFLTTGVILTLLGAQPTTLLLVLNLVWTVTFIVIPVGLIALSGRRCLAMSRPDRA